MATDGGSVKAVVAVVIIVFAVGFLYWYYGTGYDPSKPRDRTVLAIDIEDHKVYKAVWPKGGDFPLKNPKTGRLTLWQAYANHEDKFLFPVPPKTRITSCPITGKMKVGSADLDKHKDWPVKIPEGLQP